MQLKPILQFLEQFAPLDVAESWDNVGLLCGDPEQTVENVLTCLTLTPDVAEEAIQQNVQLIVTHHPILFRPVQKLTSATPEGAMLLRLLANQIAVYSPHTAFDSAAAGINQQWSERFQLQNIQPLRPFEKSTAVESHQNPEPLRGAGRWGQLLRSCSLQEFLALVQQVTGLTQLQYVGDPQQTISTVGIACGSAAEFMREAQQVGCEVLVTGEARFHGLLEARSRGIALVLLGHYASEKFACDQLAEVLQNQFPELNCRGSVEESDPLQWT